MMDAGLLDNKHDDNNSPPPKEDASQQGDVKSQEVQDDGYETSNGADQQQQKQSSSSEKEPSVEQTESEDKQQHTKKPEPPGPDLESSKGKRSKPPTPEKQEEAMEGEGKQQAAEGGDDPDATVVQKNESKSEMAPVDEDPLQERLNDPLTEADSSASELRDCRSNSNSPKRSANMLNSNSSASCNVTNNDQLVNEDSNISFREQMAPSPCASNSRSNSSSLDRQQNLPFNNNEGIENLAGNDANLNPLNQEDSSSQSQGFPVNTGTQMDQQMNPYDMKRLQQSSYMPMSFDGIKREPYDMSTGGSSSDQQHNDLYGHFKRQNDPYSRDNLNLYRNQYKRPEDMFLGNYNKEEMNYGGSFGGIRRDNINPYYNSGQFVPGLKREHEDVMSYNGIKRECSEDPYSFVDEDAAMSAMLGQQGTMGGPGAGQMRPDLMQQHMMQNVPKKRGRKKKIRDECEIKQEPGPDGMMPLVKPIKERKKHDRFNGMPEEEVCRRTLPDHLAENLDIIIIGINPGLFAAYKGHHYAGPGNHFWKCLYLSGLTQEQMSADEDYKLLHFGIGFTNMVSRATKGSADLTRKEIKEGSQILLEKLQTFRPKIAVFNGKLIYEVFSGKKDFNFGRQPDTVHGTNTYMWVMPSSSARCAQLPRAADKVPFYSALRRFRDYLNGTLPHVDESELVFPDTICRREKEENEIRRLLGPEPTETMVLEDGTEVPIKKKRGRPKKIKLENGEVAPSVPRPPRPPRPPQPVELGPNGELPPKKKRGRPKKVRPEDQAFMQQQQQNSSMVTPLPNMPLNSQLNMSAQQSMDSNYSQNMLGSNRDYTQQNLNMDTSSSMMYNDSMGQNSMSGGGPIQGQNLAVNVPQTSPYFSQGLNSGNQESSDVMQSGNQTAMNMRTQPSFRQSPGPFSQSPRSQGVGYGSSPRPPGYSQSPQRHQIAGSYSNSPAHQQQSTALPFSQSPIPHGAHYSESPPLRPLSQNHNYSQQSPVPGHPFSRSPVPQNNTPTYSQQSPMFAQSPANLPHPYSQSPVPQSQRFSQASPASQNMAYQCRSPGPSVDHSAPSYQSSSPLQQSASYPQLSPARGNQTSFSQSPIPQNSGIYAHPQMMSPGSSQNYSQRSHPYSPAPHLHSGYGQSPIHQPQARQNTPYNQSPPQNMSMSAAAPTTSGNASAATIAQQYQSDLSSEISAAISSPGPASPGIGHIDFEPPIIDSQIQNQEAENSSSRSISQRTSPGGDQITSNDLAQSNSNLVSETALNAMGDVSHASSHDSNDIMDTCTNPMIMSSNHTINNQNRHSAMNLIGPSSSSNTSSPIPSALDATKPGLDMTRSSAGFGSASALYNTSQPGSNEAQSPVSNEQRIGFQVPTPSGSANSSYGTATPVAADLSNVARNSPRDIDNASVASVSSQHERTYPLASYADTPGSPRQSDAGGILAHHAASMYHSNPFSRMGSTPPQSSPFSSQSGGAFRGLSGLDHGSPQQGPVDYGSPVKQSPVTSKQQDVSSKSLSGLESLVDQIPSIADGGSSTLSSEMTQHAAAAAGPTSVPTLENPYAAHPSLYNPYPYQPTPYAPPPVSNNSYSTLAASSFVGYPASPYGQLMRPTPGYLPEALSAYHPAHHSGYPGLPTQQYGPGAGYGPAGPTPNYSAYYNGYGPPSIPNTPNMPTYLTSHVLDHIHKNAAADASSVSFGGFC